MSLLSRIVRRVTTAAVVLYAGSIDNAETTDENINAWRKAKDTTAVLEVSPQNRRTLRARANYEKENNAYCSGMVSTLAKDLIGYTLPKLRLSGVDAQTKTDTEKAWEDWAAHKYVNLSSKLRILDETSRTEGNAFLYQYDDEELLKDGSPVSLNVNVLGDARVTDPNNSGTVDGNLYNDDGVIVNLKTGRTDSFMVAPPDTEVYGTTFGMQPVKVSADKMYHWFRPRRSGQYRGYCDYAAALGLFNQLRRYDLATLTAAEIAAMLAGIMKTSQPVDPDVAASGVKSWKTVDLERGTLLGLPAGWDAVQFKPEQPLTQYEMFINLILRQIGRCLDIPFGIMVGDCSSYNYSSIQMEYKGYDCGLTFDRGQLNTRVLDPLFTEWLFEYATVQKSKGNRVLRDLIESNSVNWTWTYATRPSANPELEANADNSKLETNTTTLQNVYAAKGQDWEEALDQRAKEISKVRTLGLDNLAKDGTMTVDNGKTSTNTTVPPTDPTSVLPTDQTDAAKTGDVQATALNGAQITSLLAIADHLVAKQYPAEAAIAIIQAAFPLMNVDLVKRFVNSLAGYTAPTVPATPVVAPVSPPIPSPAV